MTGTVVHASNLSANAIRCRVKTGESPEACGPDNPGCTAADTKNTVLQTRWKAGLTFDIISDLRTHHGIRITHI
ncbi:hypothetical protein ACRRTK_006603 [Alexandromys fortis]